MKLWQISLYNKNGLSSNSAVELFPSFGEAMLAFQAHAEMMREKENLKGLRKGVFCQKNGTLEIHCKHIPSLWRGKVVMSCLDI